MINELIKNRTNVFHILYFAFDEVQPTIEGLLNTFATQTDINFKKEQIYLFLDEIQKLPNFQNQIKVYYDLYPNIKFVISGSTSFYIRKKSQESLAGRTVSFVVKPLSFDEYLLFREKSDLLRKPKLYEQEIKNEFAVFLRSQFIESIVMRDEAIRKEYFSSIIKKIIYEDLPSVVSFDNPSVLLRMVQYIAQQPGCIINNLHLAQELHISNKTVALYLSYLEDALLIKKFYNFSRNLITSEKRFKKYYLASPSFSSALVDFSHQGILFENYVASIIRAHYFYRDVYQHEVDFICTEGTENIIPLEAKQTRDVTKQDAHNILLFMNKFSIKKGVIIYGGVEKKTIKKEDKEINLIPYFLFS